MKGHYREIIRDSKGRFVSTKKWSSKVRHVAKSRHDMAVDRIAKRYGGKHRRKGIDLLHMGLGIEVAIDDSDIYQSIEQLKRSRATRKYIAVPSSQVPKACKLTMGTGIGVMNLEGTIKKRTRRKKS